MMCIEVANPTELNLDKNSETWTEEESVTHKDWIDQSHKNEVQLEQAYVTEIGCQNDQSRKEDPCQIGLVYQPGDIIVKMNQNN